MIDRIERDAPGSHPLGRVSDSYIDEADVCLAGIGELVARAVGVTVRQVRDVPGWVGLVEADLGGCGQEDLELRTGSGRARCRVMFPAERSLVRGSGAPPREAAKTIDGDPPSQ